MNGELDGWGTGTRRRLLAGATVVALLAAGLVSMEVYTLAPFLLWLTAALLAVVAAGRGWAPRLERRDWVVLVGLTALGAGLRLAHIEQVPPGLWIDELSTAVNSLRLADGPFRPFASTPLLPDGPQWVHTTNLYLYACAAVLKVAGATPLGVCWLSLLPAIAAPPLLFVAARTRLDRDPALLAAGLLAASRWHVLVSRWGWDEVLVTTLAIGVFGLLLAGNDGRHPGAYLLAGALAGVALYAYVAARLIVPAAALFLLLRFLLTRRRELRAAAALFCGGLWVASAPLLSYWLAHPEVFAVRITEVELLGGVIRGELAPLLRNAAAYALMFHVRGDPNPRQALPDSPALDPVAGALFAVGVAIAIWRWRRPLPGAALAWLGVGLLGGLLTEGAGAPNTYRVGLVAPACTLLAGLAWQTAHEMAGRRRRVAALAMPLGLLVVAASASFAVADVLIARPACRPCWHGFAEGAAAELIRRRIEPELKRGVPVLLDRSLGWPTARMLFEDLLPRRPGTPRVGWIDVRQVVPAEVAGALIAVAPSNLRGLPAALQPAGGELIVNPFGERIAYVLRPGGDGFTPEGSR